MNIHQFNRKKKLAIFDEKIEIRERCKGVHCVDLSESFPTSIYLQKSASIQPRTSPSKFGGKLFNIIHSCPYSKVGFLVDFDDRGASVVIDGVKYARVFAELPEYVYPAVSNCRAPAKYTLLGDLGLPQPAETEGAGLQL